jgi:phosphoribosylamine--glycine ligase
MTAGGRVLSLVATAPTLAEAREKAYANLSRIRFEGMHYRRDIGTL